MRTTALDKRLKLAGAHVKHLVEALESTMGWKDGHPLPGRLDIYDSIKTLVSRH